MEEEQNHFAVKHLLDGIIISIQGKEVAIKVKKLMRKFRKQVVWNKSASCNLNSHSKLRKMKI
jgi:hypothetical protein